MDQFLEQLMGGSAESLLALQQLLESVGGLAIAAVLAFTLYLGTRIMWRSLEQNKTANEQNAELIKELKATNTNIKVLTDSAIRIEGHAKDAATSSYKSVEQTEATLRDIKKLERILTDGIASILTAQNDHEGKAMTRQTGTQSAIDRLEQSVLDVQNRIADFRRASDNDYQEQQRSLDRIIRYTKPKTTGSLPVEDVEEIEAEENKPPKIA